MGAAAAFTSGMRSRQRDGDASPMDVVRAQAEELEARRLSEAAERRRALQGLALAVVLGAERPAPVQLAPAAGDPEVLPPAARALAEADGDAPPGLVADALAGRPDLRAARALLRRSEEEAAAEARRMVPLQDVLVGVGVRATHGQVGGVVQVAAPVPLFDRNQGRRQGAEARVVAARAALRDAEQRAALEIESARVELRGARRALRDHVRPLVAAREAAREATQRQFRAGVVGLIDLLTAERDLLAARRALAQAERDAAAAAWSLVQALALP